MEMLTVDCDLVCERISEACETAPDSIALSLGHLTLSYKELDLAAGSFAGYLAQAGVASGDTVAICMERSFEWIVAALAILRVGAAYVPLDSEWPETRLRFALEDSGASALVARTETLDRISPEIPGIDPLRDAQAIAAAAPIAPRPIDPEAIAYVIYTSGSTGVPKGVEITHANLAHLIRWHLEAFGVTRHDRASHLAGLGFDAAVWEIWPYLAAGATLCLAEDSVRSSPELIQQWMLDERVTIGFVPTVHAGPMMAMSWPARTDLRFLLTGGDALHRAPATPLPFQVVNNYGPTECTVVSTSSVLKAGSAGTPPIGRAIAGATVYLLDDKGAQVRDGQVGEICIGGDGVGRGYRNLPELTRQKFVPDPFAAAAGARMYRSGDRGVRRPDGEIEFRGRIDRQAKVRGHRIELDEIAAVLGQHRCLGFATATVDVSETGENQLVAYVLPAADAVVPTAHDLQDHLMHSLPQYMVPSIFVRLSALPLSPSGKIDLSRLPPPSGATLLPRGAARKPATPIEEKLLGLVQSLLQSDAITPEDNFFLAGGHSLLGMQLIMRVRSAFGVDLSLRQLFEAPTVVHLALLVEMKLAQDRLTAIWKDLLGVDQIEPEASFFELGADDRLVAALQRRIVAEFGRHVAKAEIVDAPTILQQAELMHGSVRDKLALPPGVVAMQPQGARNSIFWLHYPSPNLAKAMGEVRPFLYVTLTDDDLTTLSAAPTLQQVAARFVSKIVEAQPDGPYTLGGFCLGGILSYEVACQLQAAGHAVSHLVLLDAPSPQYYGASAPALGLLAHPAYLIKRIAKLGLRAAFSKMAEVISSRFSIREERKLVPQKGEPVQLMIEAAAARYEPSRFEGNVALIMASGNPPHVNFLPWWQSLLPRNLETQYVDGQHLVLIEPPVVHQVAEAITSRLARAEDERLLTTPGKSYLCATVSTGKVPERMDIEEDDEEQGARSWSIGAGSMHSPVSAAPRCS